MVIPVPGQFAQAGVAFVTARGSSQPCNIHSGSTRRDSHRAHRHTHSDRVADSVQRIDELQRKYIAEVEQSYQIYDEIQAAIEALPDIRQTIAVHYHYLQDMKIDFICVKLDLSKSTVAKLLSTALDALEVPDATASMPDGV